MVSKPKTTTPKVSKDTKKPELKPLEKKEPLMTIKFYAGYAKIDIDKSVNHLSLIKIIINSMPLCIREVIFSLTADLQERDMLEKTLTRVASKTLRTGRPY